MKGGEGLRTSSDVLDPHMPSACTLCISSTGNPQGPGRSFHIISFDGDAGFAPGTDRLKLAEKATVLTLRV